MTLEEISKKFGNQEIFKEVSREITRGDKIALIGANGTGKSTFLRIIADHEKFDGKRAVGHNVLESFYAQHQLESLHLDYEILEELKYDAPQKLESELRGVLGCFLFSGDDAFKKIKVLSGGEKARVSLAKTLVSEANFLLLDEPTNHLDIDSIEVIIEALKRYEGTLIFVSHNRYFIEKLANKIWWIEDHDVKEYPGTYKEYLYKLSQENNQFSQTKEVTKTTKSEDKSNWKQKDEQAEQVKKLNKEMEACEAIIQKFKQEKQHLELQLATAENWTAADFEKSGQKISDTESKILDQEKILDQILEQLIVLSGE